MELVTPAGCQLPPPGTRALGMSLRSHTVPPPATHAQERRAPLALAYYTRIAHHTRGPGSPHSRAARSKDLSADAPSPALMHSPVEPRPIAGPVREEWRPGGLPCWKNPKRHSGAPAHVPLCYAFAFALVMVMGLAGWRELALREARLEKSPKPGFETAAARSRSRALTVWPIGMPGLHRQRCSLHIPFLLTDHACTLSVRRSPSATRRRQPRRRLHLAPVSPPSRLHLASICISPPSLTSICHLASTSSASAVSPPSASRLQLASVSPPSRQSPPYRPPSRLSLEVLRFCGESRVVLLEQHDRTLSMGRFRCHLAEIVSSLNLCFFGFFFVRSVFFIASEDLSTR